MRSRSESETSQEEEPSTKFFYNGSALHHTIGKQPHRPTNPSVHCSSFFGQQNSPRNGFVIRNSIEVDILERLRNRPTRLRIIDQPRNDVHVQLAFQVIVDRYVGGEVERAVERASAVPGPHRCRRAELPDVVRAERGAVQALLDAVALALDFWEGQVDFGDDAGYVEAASVSAQVSSALNIVLRYTCSGCNHGLGF